MSSPYVVLENRPLDQWKVTELKEELKRRKLMTKGLKDDLVKRLDEAVRAELEQANQTHDNGVNDIHHPEDATVEPIVSVKTIMDDNSPKNESLEKDNMSEKLDINESLEKDNMADNLDNENRDRVHVDDGLQSLDTKLVTKGEHGTEGFQLIEEVSVKTCITVSELMVSEEVAQQDLQKVEINKQPDDEVSQVKSDSISIDNMSVIQKIELKDDVIADDDVKLEVDVKPEVSLSKVVLDDGKTESVIVDEPHEEKVTIEEKDVNIGESINILKRNDSGSPEKLNLDRSSGDDDIMEEDVLDGKQVDSIGDWSEKNEGSLVKEDVVVEDTSAAKNTQSTKDQTDPAVGSTKRKLHDQEAVSNNEAVKRQRRWNSQQQTNNSSSVSKHTFQVSMKHSFSRSDSSVSLEEPKEHVVPPSSKPPTTSLRIDRFLRPFTLKAVQQLLGKTGTVVSFWMDHIKTHCYVTYSSVEEAVETRNAVYNLQWPANGGRLLIAEFVDPSEVKSKTEAPLPSPVTPVSTTTTTTPQPLEAATKPPPAPQQQLPPPPPLPLPSPPPLSHHPPQSREAALPPPPLLPEKADPQIVTLDDLFRKTRATPRIYYLPLSEEQVAAKLNKTAKQSAGIAFRNQLLEKRWSSFGDRFTCSQGLPICLKPNVSIRLS